jgi:hypothetical protein
VAVHFQEELFSSVANNAIMIASRWSKGLANIGLNDLLFSQQ